MSDMTFEGRRNIAEGLRGCVEWSDAELLWHMRESAAMNGGHTSAPLYDVYRRANPYAPSRSVIASRWGTWNGAMRAAGFPLSNRTGRKLGGGRFPPRVCLEALRKCAAVVGRAPTVTEYDEFKRGRTDVPCSALIRRQLGNWIAALEAAGLTR